MQGEAAADGEIVRVTRNSQVDRLGCFFVYRENGGESNSTSSSPRKVIVACGGSLVAALPARDFPFLRLPVSAAGSGRLRRPYASPEKY